MNQEERRIVGLSALGGMLELYDFAIYGTFAIYFSHKFFPSGNQYTTLLETYMVFLLGFILRPIGGIIFSHIGDEHGRKKVLVYTILIMGISSLGIALLPTYEQIGMGAPLLLLLMRLLQGLAVGGELPTTFVYISESMSSKRLLAFGITMAGVFSGYLFAAIINFIMTKTFSKDALNDYAWRLPFAIGGIVCFVSYRIRKTLRETKAFQEVMNKPKLPLVYLIRNFKPQILAGVFFSATQQVFSIVGIIYMPSYLNVILKLDTGYISNLLPCALIATVLIIAIVGIYFNKLQNVYKLMLTSLILNLLVVPIAFFLISSKLHIVSGYIILMALHGLIGLMVPLYITLLFPTSIRLSGVALCYNISVATFGGTAPIVITTLLKQTGLIYLIPVSYILVFIVLSIIFTLVTRKTTMQNMAN